jgi:nucleotide-binding universal stress UspA family protein
MTCHDDYMERTDKPVEQPRYVVGLDGSAASATALRWALSSAESAGAVVEAVHVYAARDLLPAARAAYLPAAPGPTTLEQEGAETELRRFVLDATGESAPRRLTLSVVEGNPGRRLVDAAAGADLLVLGATHRRAVAAKVMGSTVARCSEHAPCPVVVVPASVAVAPVTAGISN